MICLPCKIMSVVHCCVLARQCMAKGCSRIHSREAGPQDLHAHGSECEASLWRVPPGGELRHRRPLWAPLWSRYGELTVQIDLMVFMAKMCWQQRLIFSPLYPVTVKSRVQVENWEPHCNFYDICESWCNHRTTPCDWDSRQIPIPVFSKALMKNTKGGQFFGGTCLINKLDLASWHKLK